MSFVKILILLILLAAIVVLFLLFTPWGNDMLVRMAPRPQEPKTRPYVIKEVDFNGGAEGVTLTGELTMPREGGPFPAIVMATGSGPQNRDEEIFGHKHFLVFSDYMTRRGYAVLRVDDRGVGASSGNFDTATTQDFADDAAAAMHWLKMQDDIDLSRVGYAGHSEGGYIAPLAALQESANFLVILMGPALNLGEIGIQQNAELARLEGMNEQDVEGVIAYTRTAVNIIRTSSTPEEAEKQNLTHFETNRNQLGKLASFTEKVMRNQPSVWLWWLLNYDPLPALQAFEGPVLATYGGKDWQVPAETNIAAMEQALVNPASKVINFPNLNHMFQPSETGHIDEYWWKTTTFDENAMKVIADWLDEVVKP